MQGPAHDRTRQSRVRGAPQVVERRDPARHDHVEARDRARAVQVGSGEHPVARRVRIDHRARSERVNDSGELDGRHVEHHGRPGVAGGHAPVSRIDPDREPLGAVSRQQLCDQVGVHRGATADHHAARAPPEQLRDGRFRPESPTQLDGEGRTRQEPARQLAVVARAVGAVEIDEMDPTGPVARVPARYREGVIESGGTRDAPAPDVNGGIKLHR